MQQTKRVSKSAFTTPPVSYTKRQRRSLRACYDPFNGDVRPNTYFTRTDRVTEGTSHSPPSVPSTFDVSYYGVNYVWAAPRLLTPETPCKTR